MSRKLLPDCLNNIFEFLEDDKGTLYSCLLVNRLWCNLSVRILWRKNICDLRHNSIKSSKVLGTLISCLSNESKNLLYENKIFIPTPTIRTPLFDYASFCKFISIDEIYLMIENFQEGSVNDNSDNDHDDNNNNDNDYNSDNDDGDDNNNDKDLILIAQEIIKMFMKRIPSLKKLNYNLNSNEINHQIPFIEFPGARNCLTNLSELNCNSNIHSEFFYQMSKICHSIQSLTIEFDEKISSGLNDLIISQKKLYSISLIQSRRNDKDWTDIIPSLIKHSNTVTKLILKGKNDRRPLSFITNFINLQDLAVTFDYLNATLEDFKDELRYFHFQKLQNLKFGFGCPKSDILVDFIKINGKNLNYLHINRYDNLLNISIPKLCPNLKFLYTIFINKESLIDILNGCKHLECIQVMCGHSYIKEKDMLEAIVKYSPKCFHEIRLYNYAKSYILSKDLDTFFFNWSNRIPQKSITFICLNVFDNLEKRNVKIIEKYRKLGVIKNARTYL
ncbi:hypothetical protein RclHR1_00250002 [Rhizophagus clarus]|uniref:F-box domain-containing protein n=1 Tax=Rhizophagus clarus TaxID=94130 RepID=A0A2Z6RBB1_9GLOM|nr:hypothetical protein RclHR1_00250002 [Rhizophagus clarus]GET01011.1 hypothetical protein GLOIN_2v1876960 [Rhizophagus clarus]